MSTEHIEFLERDEFLQRSGAVSRRRVWAAIAAIYLLPVFAGYLRFDADLGVLARTLLIAGFALAACYGVWRGGRASDRILANWPGGEEAFRADFAAWHGRMREHKRAQWRLIQRRGRLRYLRRKAPVYVLILTPLILGVLGLVAPGGLVPGRALPGMPRSLLWFGAALGSAIVLSAPLTLLEWTRAERSWAALDSDAPAV